MRVDPLRLAHALYIVEHIRPRDAAEIRCVRDDGDLNAWAIEISAAKGHHYCFMDDDGIPVAMGGWTPTTDPKVMLTWLCATDQIGRIGTALHRFGLKGHRLLASTGVAFRTLGMEYPEGERWLKRLGYSRGAVVQGLAKDGQPLVFMEREAAHG